MGSVCGPMTVDQGARDAANQPRRCVPCLRVFADTLFVEDGSRHGDEVTIRSPRFAAAEALSFLVAEAEGGGTARHHEIEGGLAAAHPAIEDVPAAGALGIDEVQVITAHLEARGEILARLRRP